MAEFIPPQHQVPAPLTPKSATATSPAPPAANPAAAPVAQAPSGRPASSYGTAPHDPSKPPVKRQIVCFGFYKVMPEWRGLPAQEKGRPKGGFAGGLGKWE